MNIKTVLTKQKENAKKINRQGHNNILMILKKNKYDIEIL